MQVSSETSQLAKCMGVNRLGVDKIIKWEDLNGEGDTCPLLTSSLPNSSI